MRDSIGNPTNDFVWRYTWQHGRQLASMTKLDGSAQWNYTYNADGLRTQRIKTVTDPDTGETISDHIYNYTYNGDKLTHMTVDGHTMYFTYDASGVPLTMVYDGNKFYYVTNLQGDVISIINGNGQEFVRYTYDAWGKLLSVEGTATNLRFYNPLRYRGYVYDEETGLYYLQSRYYNPEMGRFINGDSYTATGQGVLGNNMFAYCGNNPVSRRDNLGQRWENARYDISYIGTDILDVTEGDILYYTTISYESVSQRQRKQDPFACYTVTFIYSVSTEGVIQFNNEQDCAHLIERKAIRDALAYEMYRAASSQGPEAMKRRTVQGISAELIGHYKAFKWITWGRLAESAKKADMGSVNKKSKPGHDGNAWVWEIFSFFF